MGVLSGGASGTAASPKRLLWLLAFANFAVGMGAFVVIGVLSPVAADLAITKAQAGLLLTVYAIVYAVASPVLVALTGKVDRAPLLTVGMALFALGAVAAAFAPNFLSVLVARSAMAVGAGLVTPVAATVAMASVGAAERGRALALVFGGLTLAQALGVPLGAWIGYAFDWRAAFFTVAVLSAIAALACWRMLPKGVSVPVATLASLGAVLTSGTQVVAVALTALFMGALYVVYTFIAPFLEERYQLGRDGVSLVLALFGAGAVIGNVVGGRLTDRIGPQRTLLLLCAAQLVLLPCLTLLKLPFVAFGFLVAVWSICGWAFMVPQQARLAALSPQRVPVLFALNASAIYVGGSIGSALGAWVLRQSGFEWLGAAAGGVMLLALASLFWRQGPRATKA
jgi:MFS transporter, DHA1 family, inner membrane transport protein